MLQDVLAAFIVAHADDEASSHLNYGHAQPSHDIKEYVAAVACAKMVFHLIPLMYSADEAVEKESTVSEILKYHDV